MNLWVRSQDKTRLIPKPNLYVVESEAGITYIGDTMVGHIGKYATKERALEVLDEIQEFIENKDKIKITRDVNGITSEVEDAKKVYQMPEE